MISYCIRKQNSEWVLKSPPATRTAWQTQRKWFVQSITKIANLATVANVTKQIFFGIEIEQHSRMERLMSKNCIIIEDSASKMPSTNREDRNLQRRGQRLS